MTTQQRKETAGTALVRIQRRGLTFSFASSQKAKL
jgi:hypothetical protein